MVAGPLRSFVVVNPTSSSGATGRRWPRIARTLHQTVGQFEYAFTQAPQHATALTRDALEKGFEMVVAVGGDGTVNEVGSGFFEGRCPVAPRAVLGVVPQGTGCDFARAMGIAATIEDACARLARPGTRVIDVGHVTFLGPDDRHTQRVFLNEVSFGCAGAVAHALPSVAKRLGGKLAFLWTTATILRRYRDETVTVTVDDGTPEQLTVTNYAVCNGQYFGGGMWVAPHGAPDDGYLAVTIWAGFGLKDLILKHRALYDGTHVHEPGTRIRQAQRVVATSREPVLLEVDGEGVGRLPAAIGILPGAVQLKA